MPRPKRPPPGFTPEDRKPRRRRTSTATEAPAQAPAAAPEAADGGDLFPAFVRCRALLDELLRHDDGWVFAAPVDARALGLRDYYTFTKEPMDLGTVLRRLERRRYADPHAFADDVRLTFRNAMSYNNRGDPVYESAAELSEIFEAGWAPILASLPPPPPHKDAEREAWFRAKLMPVGAQQSAAVDLKSFDACVGKKLIVEVDLDKVDDAATLDKLDRQILNTFARVDENAPMQDP